METNALKRFAQEARRQLLAQVEARMAQVFETDSVALREKQSVITELRALVSAKGKQNLIDEVAYTWFNRLCALRYMDVNHYTRMGVVSPVEGFTQPEILQNAKQGVFNPEWQVDRSRVEGLLSGKITSGNAEQEAYRLLLVSVCNAYAREMDFLFEAIEDYTELLMPEDLLSSQSVLHAVQQTLTAENCQDVEVVGWLYQFYISEKKDQVMATKGAVRKEDIPAVTQLFTPDWIVRYLVQNSLGRLWLLNHPDSGIRAQMEFYIQPAELETDFLKVASPENLKILDPACGSGHILTYAFDLLYAIYEEQGYDPVEIPQHILNKNLYGIEIDKRAAMLSSFALMMKAMSKDKRFSRRKVSPNILEMEDVTFTQQEITDYLAKIGKDLWTQNLWEGLQQFENAKTFGSLIRPVIKDVPYLRKRMQDAGVFEDLFLSKTNEKVEKVLEYSEYLSSRYQVVVANPPYMNSSGMNIDLRSYGNNLYPRSKSDLFSMFIERIIEFSRPKAFIGVMTPFTWMYLASFELLRKRILDENTLYCLVKPEYHAFFESAYVPICAFIIHRYNDIFQQGVFIDLSQFYGSSIQPTKTIEAINNPNCGWLFYASSQELQKIPGIPIAYSASKHIRNLFSEHPLLHRFADIKKGLSTSDDSRFVRYWYEVNNNKIQYPNFDDQKYKWYPLNKGGAYRRWYGNRLFVINWEDNGKELFEFTSSVIRNRKYYGNELISWSMISSSYLGVRYYGKGFIFEGAGPSLFTSENLLGILAFLESKISSTLINLMNPTLNININDIGNLPFNTNIELSRIEELVHEAIDLSKTDWDCSEMSWDFSKSPIVDTNNTKLNNVFFNILTSWKKMIDRMIHIEEENNRIFIEAYGLQDELTPEVPLEEITLTCNPHYRYKGDYTQEQRETRLLEDTIKEFLSYAVGCMFGRYSLDKPGLILANQGETLKDYLKIIGKEPLFTPTEANVIPILDGDWFADDIVARFKQFLKVTFGEPNYDENLRFIENALGRDLRSYFLKDFYKDHVQMYKKRPIYWLFSSSKGSFNALIYMHRYHQDTVSILLNQYLREYREKLSAHRKRLESIIAGAGTSSREKTQALKERESVSLVLQELKDYEDNILFPLATQRIQIDLDDGVVVNHAKFGEALKKI